MPECRSNETFTLDKKDKVLNILTLPEEVFLFRYAPTTAIPAALWEGDEFCSVTKTKTELSIVAPQKRVVDSGMPKASPEHCGGPWNVLRVRGPLEHREYHPLMFNNVAVVSEPSIARFQSSSWEQLADKLARDGRNPTPWCCDS